MEPNNTIPHHQKAVTAVLSPEDKQVAHWWLRRYNRAVWLWILLLLPLVISTITLLFFFGQSYIDLPATVIIVVVLVPFELFFLWKLVGAWQRMRQVNTALRNNIKQVITGTLQELKPDGDSHLAYRIDNSITSVLAPYAINGLAGCSSLRQAPVILETLYLSEKDNLMLSIFYRDVPPVTTVITPVSDAEKAPLITRWSWPAIKKAGAIMLGILGVCFIMADKNRIAYLTGILFLFVVITIVLVCLTVWFNHGVQQYKQKISVTGIVTEVFTIYYGNEGSSTPQQYWYRLGREVIPTPWYEANLLAPGDLACFEHFIDKKDQRQDLIKITKIL